MEVSSINLEVVGTCDNFIFVAYNFNYYLGEAKTVPIAHLLT